MNLTDDLNAKSGGRGHNTSKALFVREGELILNPSHSLLINIEARDATINYFAIRASILLRGGGQ